MSNDQNGTKTQDELADLVKSVRHEFEPRGIESLEQTLTVEIKESPNRWGLNLPDTIADRFLAALDEFESSDFQDQRAYRDNIIPLIVEARSLQFFQISQQIEKLRKASNKVTEDPDFSKMKSEFARKFGVYYTQFGNLAGRESFITKDEARQQAYDLSLTLREEVTALERAYQQKLAQRKAAEHEKYLNIRETAASNIRRTINQARKPVIGVASISESAV